MAYPYPTVQPQGAIPLHYMTGQQQPGAQPQPGGTSAEQVRLAFRDILGRDPNPDGLQYWMNQGLDDQALRGAIQGSPEAQGIQMAPQQAGIPTGLQGSERALQGGLEGSMDALSAAQNQARRDITGGTESALSYLRDNTGDIMSQVNRGQGYLNNALGGMNQAYGQGADALNQAGQQVGNAIGSGVSALNPYAQSGQGAAGYAAALSGAQGNAAQQQAFQQFNESPGQAFLREQGEQSVLRNASALGGLGGGNVMKELTRFGTGLAQQDFNNAFNRVSSVADRGANAAGQIGSLRGQQAGLMGSLGQSGANLASNQAQGIGQIGTAKSGLAGRGAELLSQQGQLGFGLKSQVPTQLANIGMQTGSNMANLISGTGNRVAQGRTDAGNAIANAISNTTNNVAGLQNAQGQGVSNILNQDAGNIAQLLGGYGNASADDINNILKLLANVDANASNAFMGVNAAPGIQETEGMLSKIGNLLSGAGAAAAGFSDLRLKSDIETIGQLPSGLGLYRWKWNDEGKRVAGNQPAVGVIAQEVQALLPDAVTEMDGYLAVDYSRVH